MLGLIAAICSGWSPEIALGLGNLARIGEKERKTRRRCFAAQCKEGKLDATVNGRKQPRTVLEIHPSVPVVGHQPAKRRMLP